MAGTSSPARSWAPSIETTARWAHRQAPAERAALVQAYTPLVKGIAGRIYRRRPGPDLQFADLVQLGMVGLLEAIDRYTPARGVRFETFAGRRIEGAILNGLPLYSELHSQLAFRRELARERAASLRAQAGEAKRSALDRLADLAIGLALGFALDENLAAGGMEPAMPDNAYARTEVAQLRRQLGQLVQQLPDMERLVVMRHYFQQQAFQDIAQSQGLTQGRISQVHRAALQRLRERLRQVNGGGMVA